MKNIKYSREVEYNLKAETALMNQRYPSKLQSPFEENMMKGGFNLNMLNPLSHIPGIPREVANPIGALVDVISPPPQAPPPPPPVPNPTPEQIAQENARLAAVEAERQAAERRRIEDEKRRAAEQRAFEEEMRKSDERRRREEEEFQNRLAQQRREDEERQRAFQAEQMRIAQLEQKRIFQAAQQAKQQRQQWEYNLERMYEEANRAEREFLKSQGLL